MRTNTSRRSQRRAAPPPLDFPNPPCSLCSRTTVVTGDWFRCEHCGCSWELDTAHLYRGEWDAAASEEVA